MEEFVQYHNPEYAHGRWFRPALWIDIAPWFQALREHLGNFAFGLRRVSNPTLCDERTKAAA